jgi:soluble lytic murein transglycosylase
MLDGTLARYLVGSRDPTVTSSREPLARVLEGWRLAHLDDPAPLARLLADRPRNQEPDFHESYLELLLAVRLHPTDLEGLRARLDRLRALVDRPPMLASLGFGPDAFDPVITADPDGSLVLREAPWRGTMLPLRESQRRRKADLVLAAACLHQASGDAHRALFQAEILAEHFRPQLEARGLGRTLELLLHPRPFRSAVRAAARRYGVDPYLLYSVVREESKFRADAGSQAGAQGLMQIMPATAQWIAQQRDQKDVIGVRELHDPEVNLDLGAWYLDFLSAKFADKENRLKWTLAAYNGGLGNATRWLALLKARRSKEPLLEPEDVIDFPESREYVRKVLDSRARYQELYDDPEG